MKKWRIFLLVLVACLIPALVSAEFRVNSGITLRAEYNDNIDLESDNEKDDLILSAVPSLSLIWDTRHLDAALKGSFTVEEYLDYSENDRVGMNVEQPTELDLLFSLYRDILMLSVKDTYSRVSIDEGDEGGIGHRATNLTDSNNLKVNPYLNLPLGKNTSMTLGYTYENQWYEEDEGDDSESHHYSASLLRTLTDRLSLTVSGSYQQFRPKTPDVIVIPGEGGSYEYDRENIRAGLVYQVTERLTLTGDYGHTWHDYDVRSDTESQVWSAGADYEMTSAWRVGADYSQSYTMSVEDGPSETERTSAFVEYDDRFQAKFSLFSAESDYVEVNRQEESRGLELSGQLPLNDKTGITGLLRFTNFKETGDEAQEYDRFSAKVGIYYAIRMGRITTGYIYNENDSNLVGEDYTNNIVYLEVSLHY